MRSVAAVKKAAQKSTQQSTQKTAQTTTQKSTQNSAQKSTQNTAKAPAKYDRKKMLRENVTAKYFENFVESEAEKKISSYIQLPKDYRPGDKWAGDWADIESGGQTFFTFGCGVCCLSNILSTLGDKVIEPDDVFRLVKTQTDYNPDSGVGAVSWGQLQTVCANAGLKTALKVKPNTLDEFRKDVADSATTLVLVCRENDDALWFYTKGHYVNLWEYDPENDTVFVTDPSGLFNRNRVMIEDVYNALKTRSSSQYMTVAAPASEN